MFIRYKEDFIVYFIQSNHIMSIHSFKESLLCNSKIDFDLVKQYIEIVGYVNRDVCRMVLNARD